MRHNNRPTSSKCRISQISDLGQVLRDAPARIFLCGVLLLLTACVMPSKPGQVNPAAAGLLETMIAQTVEARLPPTPTKIILQLFMPILKMDGMAGAMPLKPTSMPTKKGTATKTPLPSNTPTPSPSFTPVYSVTPTLGPCLLAKFIQDINVPPGTSFASGTKFTKIWRVQNAGSCSWNRNFTLILVTGDAMGAKNQVPLGAVVAPGATTDILLELVAPKSDGKYKSGWMIFNSSGQVFGIGPKGTDFLWVDIRVKNLATAGAKTASPTTKATII